MGQMVEKRMLPAAFRIKFTTSATSLLDWNGLFVAVGAKASFVRGFDVLHQRR